MGRRLSNEEKERLERVNENSVNSIFTFRADYWGLDKVAVNNIQTTIDYPTFQQKVYKMRDKIRADIKLTPEKYLKIVDKEYRFILTYVVNYGAHTTLEITYRGLNISTVGTVNIINRILEIKDVLKRDYGIDIIVNDASYKYLEIAYTALYRDTLPKRPVDILMALFQDHAQNYTRITPSPSEQKNGNFSQTIRVKKEGAQETSTEYIFYDKSVEAKNMRNGRGLPRNYTYNIYRFEQRMKDSYIKYHFSNKSVFGEDALTDTDILFFIREEIIEKAFITYCYAFIQSVDNAKKYFSACQGKSGAFMKYLNDLKVKENETEKIAILDEEAFIYSSPGGRNGALKVNRLIDTIEKYSIEMHQSGRFRDGLCRMDGWIVEDIINDMLDAHNYALLFGLGSEASCPGIPAPQAHTLHYGVNDNKLDYFSEIKDKKRSRYEYFKQLLNSSDHNA